MTDKSATPLTDAERSRLTLATRVVGDWFHAFLNMGDFAERMERDRAMLREALRAALGTYREQWAHPGTDKNPHKLPDPAWVVSARAALAATEEKP